MSIETVFWWYIVGTMFLTFKVANNPVGFSDYLVKNTKELGKPAVVIGMILAWQVCILIWPVAMITTVIKYFRNK